MLMTANLIPVKKWAQQEESQQLQSGPQEPRQMGTTTAAQHGEQLERAQTLEEQKTRVTGTRVCKVGSDCQKTTHP